MAESVFNIFQIGLQNVHGTPVDAAVLFPIDSGSVPELDRATTSPEEDYGDADRHHASRGYHGVRAAQAAVTFEDRFQDIIYPLEMHVGGGVTPTDLGGGAFEWEYLFDSSDGDSLTRSTIEMGATDTVEDQWQLSDALINELEMGFDALTVPGASPWKGSATFLAKDRVSTALTAGLVAPTTLETMLGHYTTLREGPSDEAFADLDELSAHLAMFRLRSNLGLNRRKYGGATDTFDLYGRGRGEVTFDAMIRISATSKASIEDIWNVSGSQVTERRWRLAIDGSGVNAAEIDARVRFVTNPIADRDGEHVYGVTGYFVKDPTLASRGRIAVTNAIEELAVSGS